MSVTAASLVCYYHSKEKTDIKLKSTNETVHGVTSRNILPPRSKEQPDNPSPILVFTYMRSGSTFLADVIQSSPEVFYVMEPFHAFDRHLQQNLPLSFTNLHDERITVPSSNITRLIISYVFRCQLTMLPRMFFSDVKFLDVSRTMSKFNECTNNATLLYCGEMLEMECLKAKFVLIKSIRMRGDNILDIKNDFPQMKVVYLLRDPRAVLASQRFYGNFEVKSESAYIESYCANVSYDTRGFQAIQKNYPDDAIVVYYEIFGIDPISISKNLFRALNMSYLAVSDERIKNLTEFSQKCTRDVSLCTSQYKTVNTVSVWRRKVEFSFAQKVDHMCKDVYDLHGYIQLNNMSMLNDTSYALQNTYRSTLIYLH